MRDIEIVDLLFGGMFCMIMIFVAIGMIAALSSMGCYVPIAILIAAPVPVGTISLLLYKLCLREKTVKRRF